MMSLRSGLVVALACLLIHRLNAHAQGEPRFVEIPYFSLQFTPYQVLEPSTDGATLLIGLSPQMRSANLTVTEGHCLLTLKTRQGDVARSIVPAEILEIETPTTARIKVGKEAAALLQARVSFGLIRPSGITTAELQSLPPLIRIAGFGDDQAQPKGAFNALEAERIAAATRQSVNNLKILGLGLLNYETATGQYPPTVVYGPDGKPWHSWRVLVLPYIEESKLYQQYDFREPWDSPKNLKVLEQMPRVFRDPIHGDTQGHDTHYAALVGTWVDGNRTLRTVLQPSSLQPGPTDFSKAGALRDPKGTRLVNITDGTSNTVMVTSVSPEQKIPWTKPEDIAVDAGPIALGKPNGIAAPYHVGKDPAGSRQAPFLFADGSVRFLDDKLSSETLHALCSRDGGEVVDLKSLPGAQQQNSFTATPTIRLFLNGKQSRASID